MAEAAPQAVVDCAALGRRCCNRLRVLCAVRTSGGICTGVVPSGPRVCVVCVTRVGLDLLGAEIAAAQRNV